MEGFLRHDLNANRGRPGAALAHGTTDNPDTPVSKAAALLLSQDLQPVFGPFLRFNNWDINTSLWTGSVLVVAHHSVTTRPFLTYTSATAGQQSSEGILLDTYGQHNFWRFSIAIPLGAQPQTFQYSIEYGQGTNFNPSPPARTFTVHLPSRDQPWHWAFHSCSGFSLSVHQPDWGGVAPLWRDLLQQHQASPLHLVVGGGDQLYNDALFKLPTTKVWLAIKDAKQRDLAPFDPQMTHEVYEYYFRNYAVHFSAEAMSEAFATIPQTMTWDDHDIFDGWGSYPEGLQNCPVFQGCFQAAKRFYLLFQQHTNQAGVSQLTDMFGHRGYSMLKQCGPKLALVIPDARLERTKAQVIDPETWEMVFSRMRALPPSTRHVVMVTTVPVVYPQIPGSEKILETVSGADRGNKFANILKKTGLTKAAMSSFGEPELLDDLVDHWNAGNHKEERRMLVEKCQEISAAHCLRISFLSGDVHVCGAGRMYSDPKVNLANDHRYMPQIVSSAIVNAPPPEGVIKTLHLCSQAHKNVDKSTKEKMLRLFKNEKDLGDKLAGRRNWCEIWEANQSIPARNQSLPEYQLAAQGSLVFTLRLEMDKNHPGVSMKPFDIPVVPLMTQSGSFATNGPGLSSPTSSSAAGLSQGMGSMSLNSSNPASQGQYGQPNPQTGVYPPINQGAGGYSPLGQGQHGQLNQPGQNGSAGQGQYGQTGQNGSAGQGQYGQTGQGYYDQAGQGQYGQPNQAGQINTAGQGQYGQSQAGQGQYGQPQQGGQGQHGQPNQAGQTGTAGQGQYGQPNQAGHQGQSTGGFQTYPEMSSNSQPFSGNTPYNGNTNGASQYPSSPHAQQQQPYSGQQGNNSTYAPYPDLGNSNNGAYGQGNASQGYQNGPGSNNYTGGSNDYSTYGQSNNYSGGVQSQGSNASQYGQGSAQQNQQYGQGGNYGGNQYSQGGVTGQQGVSWPNAPQWNSQAPQSQSSTGGAQYSQHPYGNIPPAM